MDVHELWWNAWGRHQITLKYEEHLKETAASLIEFLKKKRAILERASGKLIWEERSGTQHLEVSPDLLKEICVTYSAFHLPAKELASRIVERTLDPNVFFGQGGSPGDALGLPKLGDLLVAQNRAIAAVRSLRGTVQDAERFARGIRAALQAVVKEALGYRDSRKAIKIARTKSVIDLLRRRSSLRAADRQRIGVLIGEHFGDERPPTSNDHDDTRISRMKKRSER
jgi:hypothetical protein